MISNASLTAKVSASTASYLKNAFGTALPIICSEDAGPVHILSAETDALTPQQQSIADTRLHSHRDYCLCLLDGQATVLGKTNVSLIAAVCPC